MKQLFPLALTTLVFAVTASAQNVKSNIPYVELCDLQNDPHEVRNLSKSNKSEDRAALECLSGVLTAWIEQTNDQGRIPEPEVVAKNEGATKPGAGKKAKKKK